MSRLHAFRMQLRPGAGVEYRRRHDAIWPELAGLLKGAGISDYSIHLDEGSGALFAVQWRAEEEVALADHPVMRRWWDHMADLMEVNADNSPVVVPLVTVFHLP